jgi:hypothetical protein
MYYDHAQAAYDNECREKYEELKEKLKKSDDKNDIMVLRHIHKLEHHAEESKTLIEKYRKFFQMLQELIPRQSSIHDTIG